MMSNMKQQQLYPRFQSRKYGFLICCLYLSTLTDISVAADQYHQSERILIENNNSTETNSSSVTVNGTDSLVTIGSADIIGPIYTLKEDARDAHSDTRIIYAEIIDSVDDEEVTIVYCDLIIDNKPNTIHHRGTIICKDADYNLTLPIKMNSENRVIHYTDAYGKPTLVRTVKTPTAKASSTSTTTDHSSVPKSQSPASNNNSNNSKHAVPNTNHNEAAQSAPSSTVDDDETFFQKYLELAMVVAGSIFGAAVLCSCFVRCRRRNGSDSAYTTEKENRKMDTSTPKFGSAYDDDDIGTVYSYSEDLYEDVYDTFGRSQDNHSSHFQDIDLTNEDMFDSNNGVTNESDIKEVRHKKSYSWFGGRSNKSNKTKQSNKRNSW